MDQDITTATLSTLKRAVMDQEALITRLQQVGGYACVSVCRGFYTWPDFM